MIKYLKFGSILALTAFLMPNLAWGAISYDRTPSGTNPTAPISVTITIDNWNSDINNLGVSGCDNDCNYWSVGLIDDIGGLWTDAGLDIDPTNVLASTTLTFTFSINPTTGTNINDVVIIPSPLEADFLNNAYSNMIQETGTPSFTITEASNLGGGWFNIPSFTALVASTSPISEGLFNSFLPLAFWILGIIVGVLILLLVKNSIIKGARSITRKK